MKTIKKGEGARKGEQRNGRQQCVSEREREKSESPRESNRERASGGEMMICGSLQCASVTGMALQGNMKSLLIVRSGNWSSQLLALIDLFTFQSLDPPLKKNDTRQLGHQYFVVVMICLYPTPSSFVS